EARRRGGEREETLRALSRGTADVAQAQRPQAGARHESTDGETAECQPVQEPRLRLRHADRWPPLPDPMRYRCLRCADLWFSRECLATVVDNSIAGERVARELDIIAEHRGYPCMIVSDNEPELTSNAIQAWQEDRGIEWRYIAPGKPMQNGLV